MTASAIPLSPRPVSHGLSAAVSPRERAPRYRLTSPPPASERDEQIALMQWAQSHERRYPPLAYLIAIPNGLAASSIGEAVRMKAQGMKPGVPDLFLPYPCGGKAGLWIELKRRNGGRLSADQRGWIHYLNSGGYRAVCCRGWEAARDELLAYLIPGALVEQAAPGADEVLF